MKIKIKFKNTIILIGFLLILLVNFFVGITQNIARAEGEIQITTWAELNAIRNNLSEDYILMNDLDETTDGYTIYASSTANEGAGWEPIGTVEEFTGSFDGNNHTISGLYIDRPATDFVSLLGFTSGADISNIILEDVDIVGHGYVGALVGYNLNSSISTSSSSGDITCTESYAGGLVGGSNGGSISNSYSTSAVSASDDYVGGLVGYSSNNGSISNSYSTGSVSASDRVGGLVGHNDSNTSISNSYSTGAVSGAWYVGGLVGLNYGPISKSYSTGLVLGSANYFGGLVGGHNGGSINYSFWDVNTSGQATSAGGTGKTTAEMKTLATFTTELGENSWNFADTWEMSSLRNDGYAYLQSIPPEATAHIITYTAGDNGSITGDSPQTVNDGENGTAVTAVPDEGYVFVNWSDDSTDNPRQDLSVNANISVTANFVLIPSEVYVDADWTAESYGEGLTWGVDAFNDLALALVAVSSGGTIHVGAALYDLSEMFVIDKPVNIVGPGYDLEDLFNGNEAFVLYAEEDGDPAVIRISSSDVSITGMMLANSGESYRFDIPVINFVPAESPYTNIVIENNYIAGGNQGIHLDEYVSEIEITGNDITENLYGIYMIPDEAHELDSSLFEIYHNRIYDNYSGVGLYVMENSNVNEIDVKENWWGDVEGPSVSTGENPEDIVFEVGENSEFIISDFSSVILFRSFCIVSDCSEFSVNEVSAENIRNDLFSYYFGTITVPFDELSADEYTRANVNEDLTITIPVTETADTVITLPAGTVITNSSEGENFDVTLLSAEDMDLSELSGFASGELVGAFQWGIPELGLAFSPAITVEMYVGEALAGKTLTLQRSLLTDSGWTQTGLIGVGGATNGTCLVDEEGICEFQTTRASYFGALDEEDEAEGEEEEEGEDEVEGEEGENIPEEVSSEPERAKITSWSAYKYIEERGDCRNKLKLTIKGKHFDDDVKVYIGTREASSVDRKSSKKLVARYCLDKLLESKADHKKNIYVKNPDTEERKAKKQIDLENILPELSTNDFSIQSIEGIKNIQTILVKLGYMDTQYITGFYGSITTEAVKKFQVDNGILQTGYVGPLTKAKLEEKAK